MATVRRPKWQQPPPRIPHLPRPTTRRRQGGRSADHRRPPKGQLETLFGQERTFCYTIPPAFLLNCKERSGAEDEMAGVEVGIWEEKWRFQAEILRAECKFLRTEREISAKRSERERVFTERSLKSALDALISAKRKIGHGATADSVLEEEIEELRQKLQKWSKRAARRDPELLKGSSNFGKGATLLPKQQLQRTAERCNKDFGAESGAIAKECAPNEACNGLADVEVLRWKMEGLSKGKLLKKMEEEYGLMVSGAANSASTSKLSSSVQEPLQLQLQEGKLSEQNICAGHCKVLVRRVMEQVRAETEQWSQMQEMLGQVRQEMEELQASRDFWEDQALGSHYTLNKTVQEWKQESFSFEGARMDKAPAPARAKSKESAHKSWGAPQSQAKENGRSDDSCMKTNDTLHVGKKATRIGGSKFMSPSRFPFMDLGNLSPLVRQNGRRSGLSGFRKSSSSLT